MSKCDECEYEVSNFGHYCSNCEHNPHIGDHFKQREKSAFKKWYGHGGGIVHSDSCTSNFKTGWNAAIDAVLKMDGWKDEVSGKLYEQRMIKELKED